MRDGGVEADGADGGEVDGSDRGGGDVDAVAGVGPVIVDAVTEDGDVFVADQPGPATDGTEAGRASSGGQGEVHGGSLTCGFVARVGEVGVPVQEQQSAGSTLGEGEKWAQDDAAVAAEDERELATVTTPTDDSGECLRVGDEGVGVAQSGGRVAYPGVSRCLNPVMGLRPQAMGQPMGMQRLGKLLDPAREESEH
jgi:hypothetical protein